MSMSVPAADTPAPDLNHGHPPVFGSALPRYAGSYGSAPVGPLAFSVLATPARRLAATGLNVVLLLATAGIGYLVWTLLLWREGTNPGKKLLGLAVLHADTGQRAGWRRMAVRNAVLPLALSFVPLGSLLDVLCIFSRRHQRLVDRWARTVVVRVGTALPAALGG